MNDSLPAGAPAPARRLLARILAVGLILLIGGAVWHFLTTGSNKNRHKEMQHKTRKAPTPVVAPDQIVAVPAPTGGANAPCAYRWLKKEIYRFSYERTVRMQPAEKASGDAKAAERVTSWSGVVVLDVQEVGADGTALADMRLDSPRIKLPPKLEFDVEEGDTQEDDEDKGKVADVMEDTLTGMQWKVRLYPTGLVLLEHRKPAGFRESMQKVEPVAKWRKKSVSAVTEVVEVQLGLVPGRFDDELLVCLAPAPETNPAPFDALRPRRAAVPAGEAKDERLELRLERSARTPGQAQIEMLGLSKDEPPVRICAEEAATLLGHATFDLKLGMLDRMVERYRVNLQCSCGASDTQAQSRATLRQAVTVETRVRRLAPPLRGEDEETP